VSTHGEPPRPDGTEDVSNTITEADLERVLNDVPRGAFALCGIAVALLVAGWLAIYFAVFLPRGPVS
jgi:hypothetical protein